MNTKLIKSVVSESNDQITKVFIVSQIPNIIEAFKECAPVEICTIDVLDNVGETYQFNEDQCKMLHEAEVVVGDPSILANSFSKLPSLKWFHSTWAGLEPIANALHEEPAFIITRHSGVEFCTLMAEYVISHILNWERNTKLLWKNQSDKKWSTDKCFTSYRPLHELTIGVLGTGNMGSEIAKFAFERGSKVLGFSRSGVSKSHFNSVFTCFNDVLSNSDYIINTLPSTQNTRYLLKSSDFEKLNKVPVFINVGRGNVIKEDDLINALNKGLLSGAVLDVFEKEPLPKTSPLWELSNVIITPHVSALSRPRHIADEFFKSLVHFQKGEELPNRFKWSSGY